MADPYVGSQARGGAESVLYIAIASSLVAVAALVFAVNKGKPSQSQEPHSPVASPPPAEADPRQSVDDERVVVENTKLAVKGLLDVIASSVAQFLDRTDAYSGHLSESREAIQKATSLENIKAIEQELLGNIDRLHKANTEYRSQLAKANEHISKQQEQLAKLEVDVGTDFLTGLPNRRTMEDRLRENVDRSNRYGSKFSLVIVDIDHFKKVNDEHGHMAGDRTLKAIAGLLSEHMRGSDVLARYGGEEFVMILPETADEQAERMAERIRAHVENATFKYNGQTIRVTVSAGVGEVLKPKDTADHLFERVDAALYKAKQTGRNKVVCAI